ncbi:unnamed protein product [Cylicocyclus nassatus]|uniref:Uncharacterized protein n=1 Tax=Cylicocyclus nassatus TaxID=53992 RepID=A0AA36MFF8_CYLNA|nr:unnamed protein product [Cylicocyclus nassatus]
MDKNYNYNFEQRAPQHHAEVSFNSVGVTECKKSVLSEKLKAISNGKLYHTTDTNEFFYDWNGKRYKLDLFGSASAIEDAQAAAAKATAAAAKAEKVAKDAEKVASDVKALMSGVKTIKSFTKTSNGYDLILSDGSKLSLLNGTKGDTGATGPIGPAGKDGENGKDGADGKDGEDGADGKSAYELAVVAGFNGTIDAWLASLKGADGTDGQDGADGKDGEDGLSAYDIALAKGFDGDESTWLASLKGADGTDGQDGADGKSAYEIALANGFEGTEAEWLASLKGEGEGLSDEDRAKIDSIPDDLTIGSFPAESEIEDSDAAVVDGFAKVQDVIDYVNLLLEKKKEDNPEVEEGIYFYVNGYLLDDEDITDATIVRKYQLDETLEANVFEVYVGPEYIGDDSLEQYGIFFRVDVPLGYKIDNIMQYDDAFAKDYIVPIPMVVNMRGEEQRHHGVTYKSYSKNNMARTYTTTYPAFPNALDVTAKKPIDTRFVANTFDDLLDASASGYQNAYTGLVVYVISEQCQYVFIGTSGNRKDILNAAKWLKLGGSDFNPEDAATKIITSVDDLATVQFAYPGMMVFVDGEESEEGGLFILTKTPASNLDNWKPVATGNQVTNNYFNYDTNIDSTNAPEGISVSTDKGAVVTEYVSDGLKGKGLYTSQGLNSTGEDNPLLTNVDYIDIYPADASGDSYIRLYKDGDNWANIHIEDDSLGIDPSKILVEDGEFVDGADIAKGTSVSFGNDVDFTGWTIKTNNGDTYVFGDEIDYDDVDIYRESYLPVAYINVDGTIERVLTETDKNELDEKIDNIGDNIMITIQGDSDSEEEQVSIQEVINNITNNINNIETSIDVDVISDEDITKLF